MFQKLFRNPQDAAAGLFLVSVAAFFLWQGSGLDMGTLRSMGPGMLPRSLALIVLGLGCLIMFNASVADGPALESWQLRGPVFVIGSILIFALLIRSTGLLVAGPLTMIVGAYASDEFRLKETLIFSALMTAFCILLFKVMLKLPIPVIAFM